jgi:probable rRNA maturation factor
MPPLTQPERESEDDAESEEQISVSVDDAYLEQIDPGVLAEAARAALAAEGRAGGELTIVITGDAEVQALNLQYRGIDEPTDVLSFPTEEQAPGFVTAPEMGNYLGDIVIALPFTERQAAGLGRPLRDELRLLVVHGTLHLLGYDHAEPEDEAVMWARQDKILSGLAA